MSNTNLKTQSEDLEFVDRVVSKYARVMLDSYLKLMGQPLADTALGHAVYRRFNKISSDQLDRIIGSFYYLGLENLPDLSTVTFSPCFFRYSEDDFVRQLQLLRLEADERHGETNDRVYAYKDGYGVYGYLTYMGGQKPAYRFKIRDFWLLPPKNKDEFTLEMRVGKLRKFHKYCRKAGIKVISVPSVILLEIESISINDEEYRVDIFTDFPWEKQPLIEVFGSG